ncbi:MAG TPA: glycogen debranching protein GlgX [Pseudobacteroides sp.]|uniref:glycogen debranching protein GlgX n=1 Tax=Pseudobacteroides sp. TaxID=1968840 RepID=UPI002F92525B
MSEIKKFGTFNLLPGKPVPFGATVIPNHGVNFSVYSLNAISCELVLYRKKEKEPFAIIPFPHEYKVGNVFNMLIQNLDYENIEYGYRIDGPRSQKEGHWFDPSKVMLDPYAKIVGGRDVWGEEPDWSDPYQHRGQILADDCYDWDGDRQLNTPIEELIIYEMHVRGFTRHPSSNVKNPGTYAGIIEKIPYLKKLGINCVELLPIFEFDEFFKIRGPIINISGDHMKNFWGYDPLAYFAPKAGYSSKANGKQAEEFKDLVKALHQNGIEVILDVVFNHTGEGKETMPSVSFRGIDNKTFYLTNPDGSYRNYSGCYNTVNCNHPVVRKFIVDCLRYWVHEYHIDGFRFDLASIMCRDQDGTPLANPPLVEAISYDPVLKNTKLIAEAWDAAGLYQVGGFPSYGRWSEWNGKYRDDLRRFLKGDSGFVEAMVYRLQGSPDLYKGRGTSSSINFVTCHDGFTLMDLFSYYDKHNMANGENNMDGSNDNHSWNWGCEGPTDDPEIKKLRKKLIKNAVSILMLSHGVPMLLAGDEMARTQNGNNNPYCQDNEISWINWNLLKSNNEIYNYFEKIIAFRKKNKVLMEKEHFETANSLGSRYPEISFHGLKPWEYDNSSESKTLAVMFYDKQSDNNIIYMAMNMYWDKLEFTLPKLVSMDWYLFADTSKAPPYDITEPGRELLLKNQQKINIDARSVVILIGKKQAQEKSVQFI